MVSSEPSSYPTSHPSSSPSALPSPSPSMQPSGLPSIDYGASCNEIISECFKNPKNVGICKIARCCWILKKGDIAGQR
eukprot:scaffold28490_cov80-Skeletonema_marinoi.AAC.1